MLEQSVNKLKEISTDYYEVKRIILDYNYNIGRIKAFLQAA